MDNCRHRWNHSLPVGNVRSHLIVRKYLRHRTDTRCLLGSYEDTCHLDLKNKGKRATSWNQSSWESLSFCSLLYVLRWRLSLQLDSGRLQGIAFVYLSSRFSSSFTPSSVTFSLYALTVSNFDDSSPRDTCFATSSGNYQGAARDFQRNLPRS